MGLGVFLKIYLLNISRSKQAILLEAVDIALTLLYASSVPLRVPINGVSSIFPRYKYIVSSLVEVQLPERSYFLMCLTDTGMV